ncbi:IS256 family transposase [Gemmatimonas sp.]|jgi:putative transposase|uniref:IS256 family transposase n=7 Tax=Gemmatimonas sp. TaxID=1962908 RepID=UPI0025C5CEE4|nr:IS256 family transposase [Gemmatimonas sp.]MCA2990262.1 IS256 family transposase [Gemmatimonas sp.]MCE2953402.1 IS256 family transposase [Gemmatimonas sp.]
MTVSLDDGSPKRLLQQSAAPEPALPGALRTMIQTVLQETLAAQFATFLGAAPYERAAERQGVRNGTRPRWLITRIGKVELRVPRDRAGLFEPTVFARYQRHEQALLSAMATCYLQGVSTRKVRRIMEQLSGEPVSASTVSRATKQLDAQLATWRTRPVDAQAYPYLVIDAHYERIRREGQVLSTAVLWVLGVAASGHREYLGVWLGNAESATTWGTVFQDLHARGLHGVQYVVSDEHAGLKGAVQRFFPDAVHQRCQVHYLRNALTKVSTAARQEALLAALRDVWAAPTRAEAEQRGRALIASLQKPLPAVATWLETTLSDTLGYYMLKEAEARRRLRTTNALEREHEEIRRRTNVIRIFPNEASYLRLATALAADRSDQWAKRRYIVPDSPTHNVKNALKTPRAA